jgi:hypothetical protein
LDGRPNNRELDYVTAEQLGMKAQEVRRRWPQAVEYVGLDGSPTWRREDLQDDFAEGMP